MKFFYLLLTFILVGLTTVQAQSHRIIFNTLPFVDDITGQVITNYSTATTLSNDNGIRHNGAGGAAGFDVQIPGSWIGTTSTSLFFVFRKMENDATMIIRGTNLRIWMTGGRINLLYTPANEPAIQVTSIYTMANSSVRQLYELGFTYDEATGMARFWVDGDVVWSRDGPNNNPLVYDTATNVRIGTEMDGSGTAGIGVLYQFVAYPYAVEFSNIPLPVALIYFNGILKDDAVHLSWATVTEEGFDYFTVERSVDLDRWDAIGQLQGAGDSQSRRHYHFVDKWPQADRNFYRIKATDFNGDYEYFHVVSVTLKTSPEDFNTLVVAPNPFRDQLMISYDADHAGEMHCVVYNGWGQKVFVKTWNSNAGFNTQTILSENSLAKGYYLMHLSKNGERLKTLKLLRD